MVTFNFLHSALFFSAVTSFSLSLCRTIMHSENPTKSQWDASETPKTPQSSTIGTEWKICLLDESRCMNIHVVLTYSRRRTSSFFHLLPHLDASLYFTRQTQHAGPWFVTRLWREHASMDGLMALDSAGPAGMGDVALLYRGSSGERQRACAALQPWAGQDPHQAGETETAKWRPATHGPVSTVNPCWIIIVQLKMTVSLFSHH